MSYDTATYGANCLEKTTIYNHKSIGLRHYNIILICMFGRQIIDCFILVTKHQSIDYVTYFQLHLHYNLKHICKNDFGK